VEQAAQFCGRQCTARVRCPAMGTIAAQAAAEPAAAAAAAAATAAMLQQTRRWQLIAPRTQYRRQCQASPANQAVRQLAQLSQQLRMTWMLEHHCQCFCPCRRQHDRRQLSRPLAHTGSNLLDVISRDSGGCGALRLAAVHLCGCSCLCCCKVQCRCGRWRLAAGDRADGAGKCTV
jgi:hypothetical protein